MITLATILLTCGVFPPALPPPPENRRPEIAVIIDDIGYDYANSRAAVEIAHPFAYAVLPFSTHAEALANFANSLGKDVLVHLPMEAESHNNLLGPGALRLDMSRFEIEHALTASFAAVPHAIGVNNHMGSRLTREPRQMSWLMQAIHGHGSFFFVDSRTTSGSVALSSANQANVAATARDVFIDNLKTTRDIERQLELLLAQAKRNGHALGIAHPHPITIDALRDWDPEAAGVRFVALSDYVAAHTRAAAARTSVLYPAPTECGDERDYAYTAQHPDTDR